MSIEQKQAKRRLRRKSHVRKHVAGTQERPRLTVFRSNKNIYAQIIDDMAGRTLVSASTMEKPVRSQATGAANNKAAAALVGAALAAKAVEAFREALRINPEYAKAWFGLGLAYRESGQSERVREVYERLKAIDPAAAEEFLKKGI